MASTTPTATRTKHRATRRELAGHAPLPCAADPADRLLIALRAALVAA